MDPGERTTGTRDEHYNLVSILYHALHGAENCDIYATDAEASGRVEHSGFFREAQETQRELADRAKELLGIGGAARGAAGGTPAGGATAGGDVPPRGAKPGAGGVAIGSDLSPPDAATPTDVPRTGEAPPRIEGVLGTEDISPGPGGAVPETEAATPEAPRTEGVAPGAGGTTIGGDAPTDTAPGDIPPRSADVQREPDVRAREAGAPTEDVPPRTADLHAEEAITPSDTAPPNVGVVPSGRAEVSPDVPRTEEAPPRTEAVPTSEEVLRTEDVSREPGDRGPLEEPVEAERRADTGETVQDLIRETSRRSRGEI